MLSGKGLIRVRLCAAAAAAADVAGVVAAAATSVSALGPDLTPLPIVSLSCCPLSRDSLLCLNKGYALKRLNKKPSSNDVWTLHCTLLKLNNMP